MRVEQLGLSLPNGRRSPTDGPIMFMKVPKFLVDKFPRRLASGGAIGPAYPAESI